MSILSRIGKVASGVGGALWAPVGLVKDLATAPFVDDDEYDGFINTIYQHTVRRGGRLLGAAAGPQEGLGAVFGAVPEPLRRPVRTVTTPVLHGIETAYREGISEPLSTAVTAASMIDAGKGLNIKEAYRIAQDRSVGQAIALAFLTDDITDETQVAKAVGTDWYENISGTFDAAHRLFLSPDILAAEATKVARFAGAAATKAELAAELVPLKPLRNKAKAAAQRAKDEGAAPFYANLPGGQALFEKGIVGRSVRTNADREVVMASPGMEVVKDKIMGIRQAAGSTDEAAAQIRNLMFHDHSHGAVNARVLAEADDLDLAFRALLGDAEAIGDPTLGTGLFGENARLAGEISRNRGRQAQIALFRRAGVGRDGMHPLPFELEQVEYAELVAETEKLYDAQAKVERMQFAAESMSQTPRISGLSEFRHNVTRGENFQQSIFAAPLRLASTMRPHGMVDLHSPRGDIQVARLVKRSGLALEEQDRLRGAYMAAQNPTERLAVLKEAETATIKALAEKHGLDPGDVDRYVAEARRSSDKAMARIQSSTRYDAEGKFHIAEIAEDGERTVIHMPGAVTQEFNKHALPNFDQLEKVFKKHAELGERFGSARVAAGVASGRLAEIMDDFYKVWKPSVLIRAGWPIRVTGEEQLRIMSKIGALTSAKNSSMALGRYVREAASDRLTAMNQRLKNIPVEQRIGQDPLTTVRRGQRIGTMEVRGWEMERPYGTHGAVADFYHEANGARPSFDAISLTEKELFEGMAVQASDEWHSIAAGEVSHPSAWGHAVNNQIGKDKAWRQFLEGKTVEEVHSWLLETAEGQGYASRLKHWRGREEEWLTAMEEIAHSYLPTPELRQAALENRATYKMLEKAVPDAAERPNVHGAILNEVQGKGFVRTQLTKVRDKSMKFLGQLPTDVLNRHPYFDFMYTEEVNRRVNILADQGVAFSNDIAKQVEMGAREFALNESKKLLYDMAEQSELAHMLRYVAPFYSAWQEVLTRWSGIAVENPAFVLRMRQAWMAPERAGLITDENGYRIDEHGNARDAAGNKVEAGADRFITMALPEWAKEGIAAVPGFEGIKSQGGVKFNKEGFNLVLQGAPGVGPLVQLPLNEIVKAKPELESSLKWALPFGTTQSTMDLLLPATAKRIKTRSAGEDDRVYRNTLIRLYYDSVVDYNLGKRKDQPTYEEAKQRADAFYNMRTVASFVSPVAPQFFSPYQLYIDAYRQLRAADEGKDRAAEGYQSPDEIFLDTYGEEFFPLTQSLSRSVDGVVPTLEAYEARGKYKDLIEATPELGGLIIGAEGAGEFSRSVYDSQLSKKVAPGAAEMQRESMPFEEAIAAPDVRLGWVEYGKAMDLIDAEMVNRGLPNLRVKAANDLATMKRDITAAIAAKHPEWFAEFSVVDRDKFNRRIRGMREIVADERLLGRPDISGLKQYLEARDAITAELAKRKQAGMAGTLDALENEDLDGTWEQIKTKIIEKNLAFGSLYHRWLTHDVLTAEAA